MTRIRRAFHGPEAFQAVKGVYRIDMEAMARTQVRDLGTRCTCGRDPPDVDSDPRSPTSGRPATACRMSGWRSLDRLLSHERRRGPSFQSHRGWDSTKIRRSPVADRARDRQRNRGVRDVVLSAWSARATSGATPGRDPERPRDDERAVRAAQRVEARDDLHLRAPDGRRPASRMPTSAARSWSSSTT
jgi:hypothetical protein